MHLDLDQEENGITADGIVETSLVHPVILYRAVRHLRRPLEHTALQGDLARTPSHRPVIRQHLGCRLDPKL
jgi:hypothetical protein